MGFIASVGVQNYLLDSREIVGTTWEIVSSALEYIFGSWFSTAAISFFNDTGGANVNIHWWVDDIKWRLWGSIGRG